MRGGITNSRRDGGAATGSANVADGSAINSIDWTTSLDVFEERTAQDPTFAHRKDKGMGFL